MTTNVELLNTNLSLNILMVFNWIDINKVTVYINNYESVKYQTVHRVSSTLNNSHKCDIKVETLSTEPLRHFFETIHQL